MKKLLPLLILSSLVSCGGKSGGGKSSNEVYQEALKNQTRGAVKTEVTDQSYYSLEQNADGKVTATAKKWSSTERSIILKIDGDLLYTYEERTSDNTVSKKVTLESISSSENDLKEGLASGMMKLDGNYVRINYRSDDSNSTQSTLGNLSSTRIVNGYVNIANLCESNLQIKEINISHKQGTNVTKLPDLSGSSISTCDGTLSAAELKKIDLTNIEYCDERDSENSICDQNQDKTELTSDL